MAGVRASKGVCPIRRTSVLPAGFGGLRPRVRPGHLRTRQPLDLAVGATAQCLVLRHRREYRTCPPRCSTPSPRFKWSRSKPPPHRQLSRPLRRRSRAATAGDASPRPWVRPTARPCFLPRSRPTALSTASKTRRGRVPREVRVPLTTSTPFGASSTSPTFALSRSTSKGRGRCLARRSSCCAPPGPISCSNGIPKTWPPTDAAGGAARMAAELDYEGFNTHGLAPVSSSANLRLQMRVNENFVLVPRHDRKFRRPISHSQRPQI